MFTYSSRCIQYTPTEREREKPLYDEWVNRCETELAVDISFFFNGRGEHGAGGGGGGGG